MPPEAPGVTLPPPVLRLSTQCGDLCPSLSPFPLLSIALILVLTRLRGKVAGPLSSESPGDLGAPVQGVGLPGPREPTTPCSVCRAPPHSPLSSGRGLLPQRAVPRVGGRGMRGGGQEVKRSLNASSVR